MKLLVDTHLDRIDEAYIAHCLEWLPKERQDNILQVKHLQGRREKVAAYELLLQGLRELHLLQSLPSFHYDAYGKPLLTNYPDIHFNLSHCRHAVAVVLSSHPVGVDIENIRPYKADLAARIFTREEIAEITDAPNPDIPFTQLWTRKEALVKCTGTGITGFDQLRLLHSDHTIDIITDRIPDGFVSYCEDSTR